MRRTAADTVTQPSRTKGPQRIAENIDVFEFELSTDELSAIDSLHTGLRGGAPNLS